jgi:hypothetical protein
MLSIFKKLQDIKVKVHFFLTKVVEVLIIIKNFDIKEFDKQEIFCHNLKPKSEEVYYFFIFFAVVVWFFTLLVLSWDYIIIKNTKFFLRVLGGVKTYNLLLYITNNQNFITACKITATSFSLGFMIVLQLYQMMAYVIIFHKMTPLVRGCSDKKDIFNYVLIVLYYCLIIFIFNMMICFFFMFLAYKLV